MATHTTGYTDDHAKSGLDTPFPAIETWRNQFRAYEFEIRNQIAAFLLEPGVFTPVSEGVTVYVQSRGNDNSLSGILIEDGRQQNAPATILAQSGQLTVSAAGPVVAHAK